MTKDNIQLTSLVVTFFSFALAVSIFPINNIFEVLRWVIFLGYVLLSLFLTNFLIKKDLSISFVLYSAFLLILILSTVISSGLEFKSIAGVLPFILILFLPFLPYPNSYENREQFFIKAYKVFSVILIFTMVPLVFIEKFYIMGRFSAWFINTNIVAGYSALSFGVFFISYFKYRSKKDLILLLSYFLMVLLTQSRGALACVIFIIFIHIFLNINKKFIMKTSIVIALVAAFISTQIQIREIGNNDVATNTIVVREFELGAREQIMQRQLQAFEYSPIIGVGAAENKQNPYSRYPGEASFTDMLSMVGVVGFIFFSLSIIFKIRKLENNDLILLQMLVLSVGEGYLTGVGSVISIMIYVILLSSR